MNDILFHLEKLPVDARDFLHDKVFGTIPPLNIPNVDFSVSALPTIILNQINTDFCTAFSSSDLNTAIQLSDFSLVNYLNKLGLSPSVLYRGQLAVKYNLLPTVDSYISLAKDGQNGAINLAILKNLIVEKGDNFCPLYQMAKIKQVRGEYLSYGANLRDACNALVKYGSLPRNKSPYTLMEGKPTDKDRNFLANWLNWDKALDFIASKYKLGTFFAVNGAYDAFDNCRSALYQNKDTSHAGVLFGLNWRPEWTFAPNGVISDSSYTTPTSNGHCVQFVGQKIINGVPYLVLPNTWGEGYGEKGFYYFSREVVNKEALAGYGAFTFKKMTLGQAQFYLANGIMASDNIFVKGFKTLLGYLKNYGTRQ